MDLVLEPKNLPYPTLLKRLKSHSFDSFFPQFFHSPPTPILNPFVGGGGIAQKVAPLQLCISNISILPILKKTKRVKNMLRSTGVSTINP